MFRLEQLVGLYGFMLLCIWYGGSLRLPHPMNKGSRGAIRDWGRSSLGPFQTCLAAFSGFPVNTKMKADTQLSVVMCCQIFARASKSHGHTVMQPCKKFLTLRKILRLACAS